MSKGRKGKGDRFEFRPRKTAGSESNGQKDTGRLSVRSTTKVHPQNPMQPKMELSPEWFRFMGSVSHGALGIVDLGASQTVFGEHQVSELTEQKQPS